MTFVQELRQALVDVGPMTLGEMELFWPQHPRDKISCAVRNSHKATRPGNRVYICRWVYQDGVGGKSYPRAVYAAGDKDDAPKPAPKSTVVRNKAYRGRKRVSRTHRKLVSSVFDWRPA